MKKISFYLLVLFISMSTFAQSETGTFTVKSLENSNTRGSDYGITFLNDDKIIFVSPIKEKRRRGPSGIFEGSINSEGEIINKEIISDISKNKISKTGVTYSKDLKTVYFSSNNLKKVYSKTKEYRRRSTSRKKSQIFKATVTKEGNWTNIESLPFNNGRYTSESPVLSNDGKRLYFVSNNKKETLGGKDIFVVDILEDGSFSEPKNLGSTINTTGDEVTPFITKDNMLYFSSNGYDDTLGGLDVYVSDISGEPTKPNHLEAPLNGEKDDFAFIMNSIKTRGYVSSNGLKNRKNIDIYYFTVEGLSNKECVQEISGTIKDNETNEIISEAVITLFDNENNQLDQVVTDEEGHYKLTLECDKTYNLSASNEAYTTEEYTVNTEDYIDAPNINGDKFLIKKEEVEEDLSVENSSINPIYFGFDRFDITSDAITELDGLVETLKNNSSIQIEIEAHTDSRGSDTYNLILSERRAKAAKNYLVSKEIDESRIISKGYGESRLINKCSDNIECSEEAHKENRRIEFSFINL